MSPKSVNTTNNKSFQLTLFELVSPSDADYSNSIELYDALPKGPPSAKKRKRTGPKDDGTEAGAGQAPSSTAAQVITRTFKSRGKSYQLKVKPAAIERKTEGGELKTVFLYPGAREDVVEEALRRFAVQGQNFESDGNEVGVYFSVNQLKNELARTGRTYSADEILEALDIMSSSIIEVSQSNQNRGRDVIRGPMLTSLYLASRSDYLENSSVRCRATFHPLVTQGIRDQQFRIYDYTVCMSLKSELARYIYKRLSHYWTQASTDNPYEFKLLTYLANTPRGLSERVKDNLRAMRNALESLVAGNVILPGWKEEMLKNPNDKRVIDDVEFSLQPTDDFVKFMMKVNKRQSDIRANAALAGARESLGGDKIFSD